MHILNSSEVPPHNHSGSSAVENGAHQHFYLGTTYVATTVDLTGISKHNYATPGPNINTSLAGSHTHTLSITSEGGGDAHNNMQPSIVLNWIIKF